MKSQKELKYFQDKNDLVTETKILKTLGLTIKQDDTNKYLIFLACLSAYIPDCQLNISLAGPSSSGKTFTPIEVCKYFPKKDVVQIGYSSPTAFFHNHGKFDKEKEGYVVDFTNKILLFLDQPHTLLIQHLRPLLSHDSQEIPIKITDKSEKFGLRTKNVFFVGFPVVIFCTAGLKLDEQEATRFLLLSPEISQSKLKESIVAKIKRDSDIGIHNHFMEQNVSRRILMEKVEEIRNLKIQRVRIKDEDEYYISKMFFSKLGSKIKPRHQRDIARLLNLIKILAVLNHPRRKVYNAELTAERNDVDEAFKLWERISISQELNIPPYLLNLFSEVVIPASEEKYVLTKTRGISRQEIMAMHARVYGRFIPDWQLRQDVLPMLEMAGLITSENDIKDKRKVLYFPIEQ